MATQKTVPSRIPSEPCLSVTDIDAHRADMKARAEEFERRFPLEERLKMCDPKHAAAAEEKKKVFRWKVEFRVLKKKPKEPSNSKERYADDGEDDEASGPFDLQPVTKTVEAQDERTAWAAACDKLREWPNVRLAKPKFTKLKQVNE